MGGDAKLLSRDLFNFKKHLFLSVLLVFMSCSYLMSNSFEESFLAIKELKFEKANRIARTIDDLQLRRMIENLVGVIAHNNVNELIVVKINDDDTPELKVVKNLFLGYKELYDNNQSSIEAYKFYSEAIFISSRSKYTFLLKASLIAILDLLKVEIFIGSKQFEQYLNHFRELKSDDIDEALISLYEIIFYSKSKSESGKKFSYDFLMQKLETCFNRLPMDNRYTPYFLHEKGIQSKIKRDYVNAILYFDRADSLLKKTKILRKLNGTNLWQMADAMRLRGDYEQARKYLKLSKETANNLRDDFYDDRLNAWILEREKKYDSAFYFLKKSIFTEYQMGAKNNTLESSIMAIQNRTDKLKLDNLKLALSDKKSLTRSIVSISILVLVIVISVFLLNNTTKKRKLAEQTALLEQQKTETLLKDQELLSIDAMIAGQEKERQRVANELHDDLGSKMATIKLHVENIKTNQEDPSFKHATKLLEEAYQKIRGISHVKNSGVIAKQGLLPALQRMARTISETNKIQLTVHDFGLENRMENSLELSIFRIVQELVTNIIKHAEATKGTIQLTQHEESLNIMIEDNGKGFDPTTIQQAASGIGLRNIEKRIEHLGGNFTIDSALGNGTSIIIDIPII